jgi:hypothetical protein
VTVAYRLCPLGAVKRDGGTLQLASVFVPENVFPITDGYLLREAQKIFPREDYMHHSWCCDSPLEIEAGRLVQILSSEETDCLVCVGHQDPDTKEVVITPFRQLKNEVPAGSETPEPADNTNSAPLVLVVLAVRIDKETASMLVGILLNSAS